MFYVKDLTNCFIECEITRQDNESLKAQVGENCVNAVDVLLIKSSLNKTLTK